MVGSICIEYWQCHAWAWTSGQLGTFVVATEIEDEDQPQCIGEVQMSFVGSIWLWECGCQDGSIRRWRRSCNMLRRHWMSVEANGM